MNNLMTPKQAADYLVLSDTTLAKWRCQGGGPAFLKYSARCVRYRQADLDAWLAARQAAHTSQPNLYAVAA